MSEVEDNKRFVSLFQKANGLDVDGHAGAEETFPALYRLFPSLQKSETVVPSGSSIAEAIAKISIGEIGNAESPKGSNSGPEILKYFQADWLKVGSKTDGYAWCASFVCWVVQQAIAGKDVKFVRPQTAGAWDFENWAREQAGKGVTLIKPGKAPQRGDIIVFTFSHIGIVTDVTSDGIKTVEGNTNDDGSREGWEVAARVRPLSSIRSLIRIS